MVHSSINTRSNQTPLRRVRDADYTCGGDGLFYRSVRVAGQVFAVPRNISRIPGAWQLRLNRKGAKQFNKSFADSKKPARGRYAPLSDTNYQQIGIAAALAQAIAELKRQYKKGGHARPHEVRTAAATRLGKKLGGLVTGISTKIVTPPSNRRERSPYVVIQARMGNARSNRMLGTGYRSSIFSTSEADFKRQVRKALIDRKYMEKCRATGKTYKRESVHYLTLLEKSLLIEDVDISDYRFSDLIEKYANGLDVNRLDYQSASSLICTETFRGIVISDGRQHSEKTFAYDQYDELADAQLLASLYCFVYDKIADTISR